MQVLSKLEKKVVGAGVSPLIKNLLYKSIGFIKKVIPGQKKFPHIAYENVELGKGTT